MAFNVAHGRRRTAWIDADEREIPPHLPHVSIIAQVETERNDVSSLNALGKRKLQTEIEAKIASSPTRLTLRRIAVDKTLLASNFRTSEHQKEQAEKEFSIHVVETDNFCILHLGAPICSPWKSKHPTGENPGIYTVDVPFLVLFQKTKNRPSDPGPGHFPPSVLYGG